jgi:hypothetical protein
MRAGASTYLSTTEGTALDQDTAIDKEFLADIIKVKELGLEVDFDLPVIAKALTPGEIAALAAMYPENFPPKDAQE